LQEEYTAEGIDWSHIEFVDNQDCLDTIDCKPPKGLGVMSVLDDQCNFPRSTDESFCNTIRERVRSERFSYKPGPQIDFVIDHYAGPVTYDCAGFLDKNRDTVSVDIVSALAATSSPIMQQLLPYIKANLEGKSKATVASRFREQLLDLVSRLDCTEMHFVRYPHAHSVTLARLHTLHKSTS
jgi:myosin V